MRKNIITKMCFENKMCFCSAFQIILRLKTYHQTTSNQHNYPLPFLFPILCSFLRMQGAWSRWFGLITEVAPSTLPLSTFLITFRQNLYQCGVKRNCAAYNINPCRVLNSWTRSGNSKQIQKLQLNRIHFKQVINNKDILWLLLHLSKLDPRPQPPPPLLTFDPQIAFY